LKVLHITPYFVPAYRYGGPVESLLRLTENLARIGCEVRVLTTNADGIGATTATNTDADTVLGPHISVRYCRRSMRHSVSSQLVRRLESEVEWADIVHLTAVYSFPTFPTLATCRRHGKPLFWSPRGALQRWTGSRRGAAKTIWDLLCRSIMPARTVLHVTSEQERSESMPHFPGLSTVMIANGVNVPSAFRPRKSDDTRLHIGYIGRLHPKKGIEPLLEACRLAITGGLDLTLMIAGAGDASYEKSLHAMIASLGLGARVSMLGHVGGSAKEHFFQSIDLAVFPSYTENFGLVVAEALARGIPVVAGTGTPWERVAQIGCGLWVSNSPESLSQAIFRMRRAPLHEMGARGREWMQREFSWSRVARQMKNAYQTSLGPYEHRRVPSVEDWPRNSQAHAG
jgi:glycosyltransferase involved in cell wall biosynthesis